MHPELGGLGCCNYGLDFPPEQSLRYISLLSYSASDGDRLEDSANYVRSLGIIPFAVGVGNYDITELRVSIDMMYMQLPSNYKCMLDVGVV